MVTIDKLFSDKNKENKENVPRALTKFKLPTDKKAARSLLISIADELEAKIKRLDANFCNMENATKTLVELIIKHKMKHVLKYLQRWFECFTGFYDEKMYLSHGHISRPYHLAESNGYVHTRDQMYNHGFKDLIYQESAKSCIGHDATCAKYFVSCIIF